MVRRADRDGVVETCIGTLRVEPGTQRQPAHAVPDNDRRQPGCRLDAPHCFVDGRRVGVDRAEHRLQAQRHERHAEPAQVMHPGIPQCAVADEAVHQHHTASAAQSGAEVVGLGVFVKRLAPAEHPRRGRRLAPPGAQQFGGRGARRRVLAMHGGQQHELGAEEECVAEQDQQRTGEGPARCTARAEPRRPGQRGEHEADRGETLEPGEHAADANGAGVQTCSRLTSLPLMRLARLVASLVTRP